MKAIIRFLISLAVFCAFSGQGWSVDLPIVGSIAIEDANGIYISDSLAYVACSDGLKVVNINNPSSPSIMFEYNEATIDDIFISGNYAYSLVWYNRNFCISDISNIQNPVDFSCVSFNREPQSIYVSGHYAYVTTAWGVGEGLFVFDVSDVWKPVQVGSMLCDASQELSCSSPHEIYVSGNRAYLADTDGILIVDISNPAVPVGIARVSRNGTNQTGEDLWPTGIYVAGSLAYVADDYDSSLRVLDISNPNAPILLGSVVLPSSWLAHVYVSGSHAYVTSIDGLFIIDISGAVPPQTIPPSAQISLNQTQFQPGDTMTVMLATTPGTDDGAWDVYVGLLPPDGSLYFFTYEPAVSLGATLVPACPLGPIPARTSPIFSLTMPVGLPQGNWMWAAILAKHDLSELSPISWAPFSLQDAAEAGGVTGQ